MAHESTSSRKKEKQMGTRLPGWMVTGGACGMILAVLLGFAVTIGLIYGAGIGIAASLLIPDRKPS
jgi:hypothetical protein